MDPVLLHNFSIDQIRLWKTEYIYIMPKYDGWRLLFNPTKNVLLTRNKNNINIPTVIFEQIKLFSRGDYLDGELWCGYNTFNKLPSIDENSDINGLYYIIFDIPNINLPYSNRYLELQHRIKSYQYSNIIIPEVTIYDIKTKNDTNIMIDIRKILQTEINKKGEGLVIRNPNSYYEPGKRSHNILKYKQWDETEVKIIDYKFTDVANKKNSQINDQLNKYVSSLICIMDDNTRITITFKSTNAPPIGSYIKIKYNQKTIYGVPKFASYIGLSDKHINETTDLSKSNETTDLSESHETTDLSKSNETTDLSESKKFEIDSYIENILSKYFLIQTN